MSTALYTEQERPGLRRVLRPGNTNCAGCGMSIGLQWLEQALGRDSPMLVIPACCGIVTAGAFPTTAYGVPTAASTFAGAAALATGISSVLRMNGEQHPVVCWTGDGGTYDIGLATLSAAAERDEDLIYICYDNEIYGNTGGQRSSATPTGVATTTTPWGKTQRKKDIMSIMIAHRVPYAATLSVAHREDFLNKLRTARATRGFRFLLMLSPCPTGWKSEPQDSVELIRAAVRCGVFPLYEVFGGTRYRINERPDRCSVAEYIGRQRRYSGMLASAQDLEEEIAAQWRYLEAMELAFPATADDGAGAGRCPMYMHMLDYLEDEGVEFKMSKHAPTFTSQGLAHAEHVSGYQVAKPVIIKSDLGFAMCVVPACRRVDLELVGEVLQALDVRLATEKEMGALFPDCELGAEPPIGAWFGLKTLVDTQLHDEDYVVMQTGSHAEAVEVRREDWERLCSPIVADISRHL